MGVYVVATIKSWNIENFEKLKSRYKQHKLYLITEPKDLTKNKLETIKPDMVFFPHWSYIIEEAVVDSFNCVVFHMTDLPFGRGGSPLQNLIVRGIYETKISAIAVDKGLDTGDIYLKEPLNISEGSADDIFKRVSDIVFEKMIPRLIDDKITPVKQMGEIIKFTRRKPEQSEIPNGLSGRKLYDYIRMLDGEGYPKAFIIKDDKKIYFTGAKLEGNKVIASAEIEVE